jgi:hypothetical protein
MSYYTIKFKTEDLAEVFSIIDFLEAEKHHVAWLFGPNVKTTKIKKVTKQLFYKFKYINNI